MATDAKKKESFKPYLAFDHEKAIGNPESIYKGVDFNDLSKGATENDDIIFLGVGTSGAMSNPITNYTIHLPNGTAALPSLAFQSHTDTGFYLSGLSTPGFTAVVDGDEKTTWSTDGFLVLDLTPTRVVLAGGGGLVTDNAGLTYNLTGGFTLDVGLQVLIGATDQIKLHSTADSYYNGSGKFGFGTAAPAGARVHIQETVNKALRLGTSATDYADLDFDGTSIVFEIAAGVGDDFIFQGSTAGSTYAFHVRNTDNTNATSSASVQMQVGGTSAGDPYATFDIVGGTSWLIGADNDDSDKFKIASTLGFGSATAFAIDTDRYATFTPAVRASGTAHAVQITGAINTGGTNGLFRVLGAASTGQTASTEIKFLDIDLGATVTWATGALADQRCVFIEAPTLAFAGASTVTNAATVYIDRAPQAGSNATITNAYALWVDDGISRFDGNVGIGITLPSVSLQVLSGSAVGSTYNADDLLTIEKSTNCNINLVTDVSGVNTILFSDTTRARGRIRYTHSTDELALFTAATQVVTITSGQFVGINTSGPDRRLDILDASAAQLRLTQADGSVYMEFRLDSSGNTTVTPTGTIFDFSRAAAGSIIQYRVLNGDNTSASSQAWFRAITGGSSSGDPVYILSVSGVTDWSFGIDNNDSDKLKISQGQGVGSADVLSITTAGSVSHTIVSGANEYAINDGQGDCDFRVEGDSISHLLFTDATATTENIALLAAAAPNWQAMDRGIFIGEASVVPTGNPASGGFLYVEGGALKYRGTSGTITTLGAA